MPTITKLQKKNALACDLSAELDVRITKVRALRIIQRLGYDYTRAAEIKMQQREVDEQQAQLRALNQQIARMQVKASGYRCVV